MNKLEALKLFGLRVPFTEGELRQKYRDSIKKYHPDLVATASPTLIQELEEKTKDINEARDVLEAMLKAKNPSDIKEVAKEEIRRYESFIDPNKIHYILINEYMTLMNDIRRLIKNSCFDIDSLNTADDFSLRKICSDFLNQVKQKHKNFYEIMKRKYKISDEYSSKVSIDYSTPTNIFWEQVLKVINEYKNYKLNYFNNRVNKIIDTVGKEKYAQLESKINLMIKNSRSVIVDNLSDVSVEYIDSIADKLEHSVQKLLERYDKIANLIFMYSSLNSPASPNFEQSVQELNNAIMTDKFDYLYLQLEKRVAIKKSNSYLDEIYHGLINKYGTILHRLQASEDMSEIIRIQRMMSEIFGLFKDALEGKVSPEDIYMLNKVEFIDYSEDSRIIQRIIIKSKSSDDVSQIDDVISMFKPNDAQNRGKGK